MNITGMACLMVWASAAAYAATGIADVKGTAANSPISGQVLFQDTAGGLKVSVTLAKVPAGPHAFHIHEFGSCADTGKAAGSHYNPMSSPHGHALKGDMHQAHAGDLGNITAGADGKATLEGVLPGITLGESPYTVAGRAVILHDKVDDFSQPVGNAGGRIACGPIIITAPSPK